MPARTMDAVMILSVLKMSIVKIMNVKSYIATAASIYQTIAVRIMYAVQIQAVMMGIRILMINAFILIRFHLPALIFFLMNGRRIQNVMTGMSQQKMSVQELRKDAETSR